MKTHISLLILFLAALHGAQAQTRLYFPHPDGTCDSASYREIIHSSGLVVTHDRSTGFRRDTAHKFKFIFEDNKINCEISAFPPGRTAEETAQANLGLLTVDKKIIDFAIPSNEEGTPSAYIKNARIYGPDQKLLGYIQGEDLYGAALYLLHE